MKTAARRNKRIAWAHIVVGGASAILGFIGAAFAMLGICVVCIAPVLGLMGMFGLTVGVIADYNIFFIILGIVLVVLGVYLHRRKCEECEIS